MSEDVKEAPEEVIEHEAAAPEFNEEEYRKQKKEMMDYFKSEIPFLKKQIEYEELVTRIEKTKFERLQIMVAKSQMLAPPPEDEIPEDMMKTSESDEIEKPRRLAKEKAE